MRGWVSLVGGAVWTLGAVAAGQADLVPIGLFLVVLPLASLIAMIPSRSRLRTVRWLPDEPVPVGTPIAWHVGIEAGGLNPGGVGQLTEYLDPALGNEVTVWFGQTLRAQYVTASVRATPLWRGRHAIGPTRVILRHGFGFALVARTDSATGTMIATPPVAALGATDNGPTGADGAQVPLGQAGVTSVDDATIREYADGDDIRRIHWRSSARLGQLMVRREDATWDPRACILLDTRERVFDELRPDPRFEAMVTLAASIAVHLVHAGYAVSLATAQGDLLALNAAPLLAHSEALLWLADVQTAAGDLEAPPGAGQHGGVLLAILGSAEIADAHVLTTATRAGRAIVMAGGPATPPDDATIHAFAEFGWRFLPIDVNTPPAATWHTLISRDER